MNKEEKIEYLEKIIDRDIQAITLFNKNVQLNISIQIESYFLIMEFIQNDKELELRQYVEDLRKLCLKNTTSIIDHFDVLKFSAMQNVIDVFYK